MNELTFSFTNIDIGVLKVKEIDFCEEVHNFRVNKFNNVIFTKDVQIYFVFCAMIFVFSKRTNIL